MFLVQEGLFLYTLKQDKRKKNPTTSILFLAVLKKQQEKTINFNG